MTRKGCMFAHRHTRRAAHWRSQSPENRKSGSPACAAPAAAPPRDGSRQSLSASEGKESQTATFAEAGQQRQWATSNTMVSNLKKKKGKEGNAVRYCTRNQVCSRARLQVQKPAQCANRLRNLP